ncbi:MAG: hypothetical protein E6K54_06625 [Gammaproteobacteria bacterium]|nr:MAG: hypothetical protein E6K54_06625 [Gammaproteobacteria bacterium]
MNKLKEQVKNDAKAGRYPNIVEKQIKLNQELDKNQRLLKKEIQTVLDNDSLLMEWRRLPQKSFELIDKQTQLAEDLTEEIINEEQAQKFKSLINAEFDIFYSEPVCELYKSDF